MKKNHVRLDYLLVLKGLATSKSLAKSIIMSGKVLVEEKIQDKPGHYFSEESKIEIKNKLHNWVSRGGVKLDHGLRYFNISVNNLVALDIGCSTGGFTHVLLEKGIKKIYAVDVGYGQLDSQLRLNPKITLLERTNARYLTAESIPQKLDLIVCDVSFISLKKILISPLTLTSPKAQLIALIKPQFEVGRANVDKGGIVRNESIRKKCCEEIIFWLENEIKWRVKNFTESPIRGAKGNVEYLIHAKK